MESDSGYTTDESDEDRMKRLIDLWWNTEKIIAKILKFVYENENGVNEIELKNYIEGINGKARTWISDLTTGNKDYKYVFEKSNKIIKIGSKAKEYINNLK